MPSHTEAGCSCPTAVEAVPPRVVRGRSSTAQRSEPETLRFNVRGRLPGPAGCDTVEVLLSDPTGSKVIASTSVNPSGHFVCDVRPSTTDPGALLSLRAMRAGVLQALSGSVLLGEVPAGGAVDVGTLGPMAPLSVSSPPLAPGVTHAGRDAWRHEPRIGRRRALVISPVPGLPTPDGIARLDRYLGGALSAAGLTHDHAAGLEGLLPALIARARASDAVRVSLAVDPLGVALAIDEELAVLSPETRSRLEKLRRLLASRALSEVPESIALRFDRASVESS